MLRSASMKIVFLLLVALAITLPSGSDGYLCGVTYYRWRCGFWGWQICERYQQKACAKVDGGWTDWQWADVDECSVMCGNGTIVQEGCRSCTNPQPKYGGASCEGETTTNRTIVCGNWECGDLCPPGGITYLPHPTNERRFYQCSNGRAVLHKCADKTVWDNTNSVCVNEAQPPNSKCPPSGFGLVPHETNCRKYYSCAHGIKHEMPCAGPTKFDAALQTCIHGHC